MNRPPQPSTYGQAKEFHLKLYEELLERGVAHVDLFKMTLRNAMLTRYGSIEAVDQEVGEGSYRGIQQVYGGLSSWRKAWSRVRKDQKARFLIRIKALDTLMDAADQCMESGVSGADILSAVQKVVTTPARVMPLNLIPQLPQAQ